MDGERVIRAARRVLASMSFGDGTFLSSALAIFQACWTTTRASGRALRLGLDLVEHFLGEVQALFTRALADIYSRPSTADHRR